MNAVRRQRGEERLRQIGAVKADARHVGEMGGQPRDHSASRSVTHGCFEDRASINDRLQQAQMSQHANRLVFHSSHRSRLAGIGSSSATRISLTPPSGVSSPAICSVILPTTSSEYVGPSPLDLTMTWNWLRNLRARVLIPVMLASMPNEHTTRLFDLLIKSRRFTHSSNSAVPPQRTESLR